MLFILEPFALALLVTLIFFTIVYLLAMHRNNNGIADLAWSPGFILIALWSFLAYSFPTRLQILATALVIVWGCRLYLHLFLRARGKPEDFRYAAWRREWRKNFALNSYLRIYVLQAVILTVIALPVLIINGNPVGAFGWSAVLGTLVWAIGFWWEALSDAQLARFKANPKNKGKILTTGLWTYTRHPNYFGEALQWWGISILALAIPGGWIGLISPILLTYLLMHISGVPLLEGKWRDHKEYQTYIKRTNAFFPGPKK